MRRRWLLAMTGGLALSCAGAASALEPCPPAGNCAAVTVGDDDSFPGAQVSIPVTFAQGPDDGQPDEGNDDVAAIALTIGIPGSGEGAPIEFTAEDCQDSDGDGVIDGVQVGTAIANGFRIVVENADCTNRDRCLCPGEGQTRDDFVNVVVFGPRTLPETGPVDIPVLPDSANPLVTIRAHIAQGTAPGEIPIHVFAEIDDPESVAKPQFAANLSIGDRSAIDQTADRGLDQSKVRFEDGTVTVLEPPPACLGDCDDSGSVAINELITGVNIALGTMSLGQCTAFDIAQSGAVDIDELITGVNNSLNGCPP